MKKNKPSLALIAVLLCCVLVFLPVGCSILYFSTAVADRLEATAQQTASFYINQIAAEATTTLDTLRGGIYYLMSDDGTHQIMRSEEEPTQTARLAVEEGFSRAFFLGKQLDQRTVTGIYLVKGTQQYLSVLRSGVYPGTAARIAHIYQNFQSVNAARELYVDPLYPDYCYMIVDYFNLDTMQPLGKIIIELSLDGLVDTAYLTTIYQQSVVMLRTNDGRILNGQAEVFAHSAVADNRGYVDVDGQRFYHISRQLSPSHVIADVFIPHSEIFEASNQAIKIYVFFAFFVFLITLIGGSAAVYLLLKPLKQILRKIDQLATGELDVRMEETPYRETEYMSAAFNNMADHLEALFNEVYEQGILLRDAEFKLLESQIRPHFIINVLELINIRCLEAGENGICRMVSNLAQLLRANITHKHEQVISFREELRYVRYYLELQKERFAEHLTYSIDLEDPAMLDYYLPKLTIQPLVENSIVHGLEPKRGGGEVHIAIWEEEDAVYIRVSDNGIGFDTSSLKLARISDQPANQHNHIALVNIARRIQLLYGDKYGLTVVSSPGRGTKITVRIPGDHETMQEIRRPSDA